MNESTLTLNSELPYIHTLSRKRVIAWLITGAYLAGAIALAKVRRPSCDEAWFAGAAWSLAFRGSMGTPLLVGDRLGLHGLAQRTYWIMPLHPVTLAGWYRLVGFSLFTSRLYSVLWGLIALWALWWIVRELTGKLSVSLFASALAGVDYAFLRGASDTRMDMMTLALGLLGLAAYLKWSQDRPRWAIFLSESFIVAGLFTHPNGMLAFLLLHAYILWKDRHLITWRNCLLAITPYLVAGLGWGLYLWPHPEDLIAQMAYNSRGRGSLLSKPWLIPGNGFKSVLLTSFGFGVAWAGPIVRLKAIILALYLISWISALAIPSLRKSAGTRPLFFAALIVFLGLSAQISFNGNDYVIYLIPWFASLLAISLDRVLQQPRWHNAGLITLGFFALLQWGGIAARVRANDYQQEYAKGVAALQAERGPRDNILGSSELGFLLGFDSLVTDNIRWNPKTDGYPNFIVIERRYEATLASPHFDSFRRTVRTDYEPIYNKNHFEIYRLRRSNRL
jgi:hypothetical protein